MIVEWLNVTGGLDTSPDWEYEHVELLREGYAWVGVTARFVGAAFLAIQPLAQVYQGPIHRTDAPPLVATLFAISDLDDVGARAKTSQKARADRVFDVCLSYNFSVQARDFQMDH